MFNWILLFNCAFSLPILSCKLVKLSMSILKKFSLLNVVFCFYFVFNFSACSEFERSTKLCFIIDFVELKWKDFLFFSDKNVRQKKCYSFQSTFLWERFSYWERSVFVLEELFRVQLSQWNFPLEASNSSPVSMKYRRIFLYSSWQHNRPTKYQLVSSFDENDRLFSERIRRRNEHFLSIERRKIEVSESFSSVNKCFTEQSSREDSQRKSLQWNVLISLGNKIPV